MEVRRKRATKTKLKPKKKRAVKKKVGPRPSILAPVIKKPSVTLKIETKTIHAIDSFNLDNFIQEYLPQYLSNTTLTEEAKRYECIPNEEWGNDSDHEFDVCAEEDLLEDTGNRLDYRLYDILNLLCAKGHIAPGSYLIKVCW